MPSVYAELTDEERDIVISFLKYCIKNNVQRVKDIDVISNRDLFRIPAIFVQAKFQNLSNEDVFVTHAYDSGLYWDLHPAFVDEAEQICIQTGILESFFDREILIDSPLEETVPASNRFVSRSDNEDSAARATAALLQLSERIESSNELIASPEERAALSKEVGSIRELIEQKTIRIATIWNAINGSGVLRWLAERAADASINALALESITYLSKLCGF